MRDPIFGHLRSGAREVADWAKRERGDALAEAMFPRPKPKPPNPNRDVLLKNLRELNSRLATTKQKSNKE
jgi:hypothetical protein